MARPKKSDKEEMATAKIEKAFWRLLETERYSDITVLRISQESGVNRNSFYYHYRDIDDLAYTAFKNNVENETSGKLIPTLLAKFQDTNGQSAITVDPAILPYAERVMLCAGSDSPYLRRMVGNLLKESWFTALSIREELLSPVEKLQVNFIFSGIVETLGCLEIRESPFSMSILSQTEIGKAAISTMKSISSSQNKQGDNF